MPNILDANGLQVKTRPEILAEMTASFKSIYGNDINLASNTPDGQMMNIFIQAYLDLLDLTVNVYNSFSPDNAVGKILGQRVAINGIQRQAGTYTITNITIVTSRACNLFGSNQDVEKVYTIQDNSGTEWQLQETQHFAAAGTYVVSFSAKDPGEVLTVPNTIQTPITIILGVETVNNPTTYTSLGINEESDAALKIRRGKSVALSSQGFLAGLLAALENLEGMNSAFVYENNTGATDSDNVPSHSIWVIVSGTSTDSDIANAIYQKRNAGAGMKGENVYLITQPDGTFFSIKWDDVLQETLFITFVATSIDGLNEPNIQGIRTGLLELFIPGVNEEININSLATDIQEIDPNALVTSAGFSNGRNQNLVFDDIPDSGSFKVNYNGEASAAINWSDISSVVEGKIQAITGLGDITCTGDPVDKLIEIDLTAIDEILTLLTITDNTLKTAGAEDIVVTTDYNSITTLAPKTKQYQFTASTANIIITEMQSLPLSAIVVSGAEKQFQAYGGYGTYIYLLSVNNSGGSIDSAGLYTAGASAGNDTIIVTDALGNAATSTVTVA